MIHSVNLGKVNTILQLLVQGTIVHWICLAAQNLTSLGRQLAMLTMWRDCVSNTRVCELGSSPANDALMAADHSSLDVCRVVAEPSNAESLV